MLRLEWDSEQAGDKAEWAWWDRLNVPVGQKQTR